MPRGRRGATPARSALARPAAAPNRPNVTPSQQPTRTASTAAHPPATQQSGPLSQAGKSPGLFGQMASTAAGVAVGSSVGHALGGMFGGSSSAPAETQHADNAVTNPSNNEANSWGPRGCETDAMSFTKCMDENAGNMQICGWYLDQLKACQSAAKQY